MKAEETCSEIVFLNTELYESANCEWTEPWCKCDDDCDSCNCEDCDYCDICSCEDSE